MPFKALGLAPYLLDPINKQGYSKPTSIQAQAIPAILQGKDVLVTTEKLVEKDELKFWAKEESPESVTKPKISYFKKKAGFEADLPRNQIIPVVLNVDVQSNE